MEQDIYGRKGLGILVIQAENLDAVKAEADVVVRLKKGESISFDEIGQLYEADEDCLVVAHKNAYVNTGLNNSLDREFGLGGAAVSHIGVSNNNTAVTAATTFLNGASAGAAANTIIKVISPTATRSGQTVTGGAVFGNADFTAGVFVWNKIGFLNTATDAGTGLIDVIGGSGGASPYNRLFTLDLTSAGTFSVTAQIAVTAVAA